MIFKVFPLLVLLGLFMEIAGVVSAIIAMFFGMLPEVGPLVMNGMGIPGAILAIIGFAGIDWNNRH